MKSKKHKCPSCHKPMREMSGMKGTYACFSSGCGDTRLWGVQLKARSSRRRKSTRTRRRR